MLVFVSTMTIYADDLPEIDPLIYDTITGENGQFIDVDSEEFLLHKEEWFTIQAYIHEALRLPITETSMIDAFAIPEEVKFDTFQALLNEYKKVHATADNWNQNIYPNIVNLALELGNYADTQIAFFGPLLEALDAMHDAAKVNDMDAAETHRESAIALLNIQREFAVERHESTAQTEEDLMNFSADLLVQEGQLSTLYDIYDDYLRDDGSELRVRIAEINQRISELNAEYDKYVTIASTTVTYAWVPFFGILAAAPVAGVYGDKAERVRIERNQLKINLAELQKQLTYRENIYISYQQAYTGIVNIQNKLDTAIPHVNKLKGHWQSINTDFDTVLDLIGAAAGPDGLENALAFVASITAKTSLAQIQTNWQNIGNKAIQFAQNANVIVVDEALDDLTLPANTYLYAFSSSGISESDGLHVEPNLNAEFPFACFNGSNWKITQTSDVFSNGEAECKKLGSNYTFKTFTTEDNVAIVGAIEYSPEYDVVLYYNNSVSNNKFILPEATVLNGDTYTYNVNSSMKVESISMPSCCMATFWNRAGTDYKFVYSFGEVTVPTFNDNGEVGEIWFSSKADNDGNFNHPPLKIWVNYQH